jgi:hypothetical protein
MRLVTSDWPSVYGWNAVLIHNLTPERVNSSFQNVLVKTGSRSLTMEHGMPWSLTMLSKNAWATDTAMYGWPSGMKWAYLENLFTTVMTTDLPPTREKPSTKSMVISAYTDPGSSRGCSKPAG